jgi:transcriptional regulator with XRE-family HTH domain
MRVSIGHRSLVANSLEAEGKGAMVSEPVTFFGQLLKRYREAARLSQSRLAQRAGFDHSYVSRLESGRRAPTREAILRLAEALELGPADRDTLLAAAGFMPEQAEHLFGHEPILGEVVELLQRQDVPEAIREDLRQLLSLVVRQVKRALVGVGTEEEPSGDEPGWDRRWPSQPASQGAW